MNEFQPGDRVRYDDPATPRGSVRDGTVVGQQPPALLLDGDAPEDAFPITASTRGLAHVPARPEHGGHEWARITKSLPGDAPQVVGEHGALLWVYDDGSGALLNDADVECPFSTAVLIGDAPSPTPAFPFVGARAQVTVAESEDGTTSLYLTAGREVTVEDHDMPETGYGCRQDDGRYGWVAARHLRSVPVSPGPDQPTEHEDWRVGEHYSIHVYAGERPVGTFHRPEDAARAVSDHQDAPALRAEVQRLRSAVKRTTAQADRFAKRLGDAARAELDAATTDGLGLRDLRVQRRADGYMRASYGVNDEDGIGFFDSHPTSYLRDVASAAVALLRARLADEATTDDKDETRG